MKHTWTRIDLLHYTSGRSINAVWKESEPNKMTEFLRFTVPIDEVVKIITGEILQTKIYEAGGDEIARESRCLITGLAPKDTLAKEIVEFDYPYDIAWKDQQSRYYRDNLVVKLPSDRLTIIFNPGSSLIFNILSASTVPSTAHTDTKFSYHAYLFNGSYADYIEGKTRTAVMSDEARRR